MPTIPEVHAAIDSKANTDFTAVGIPVTFGNVDNEALSTGTAAYIKVIAHFGEAKQMLLGQPNGPTRHKGFVLFLLHVRKGTGHADRNALLSEVINSFKSKVVGGANFLNTRIHPEYVAENWAITGVEIPFYFEES